jgi:hypothetical protein
MDERPSFRQRADVRLLAIALLTPWVLGGLAYAGPLVGGALYRGGFQPDWLEPVILIWFYSFGFPSLLSLLAWFLFGVWRLAWRPGYRRSWYGWLWPFLMWVNLCLVVPVIGH